MSTEITAAAHREGESAFNQAFERAVNKGLDSRSRVHVYYAYPDLQAAKTLEELDGYARGFMRNFAYGNLSLGSDTVGACQDTMQAYVDAVHEKLGVDLLELSAP